MRLLSSLLPGFAVLWISVLATGPVGAFTVTFDSFEGTNEIASISRDQHAGTLDGASASPQLLPSSGAVTATDGLAQTTTEYDLSNIAFGFEFEQAITGLSGSSGSSSAELYFMVDEDVEYEFSGSYTVASSDGRFVYLHAILFDWELVDTDGYLFESWQRSLATPNESFTLGMSGGDESNRSIGSLTGTLNPGRHYGLLVTAYVSSRALDPTTPATASGGVLFSIGQVPEVPSLAPAGMVLLCSVLGLAGVRSLTAVSRARRRQTPSL
jgi:hypothetical protein